MDELRNRYLHISGTFQKQDIEASKQDIEAGKQDIEAAKQDIDEAFPSLNILQSLIANHHCNRPHSRSHIGDWNFLSETHLFHRHP